MTHVLHPKKLSFDLSDSKYKTSRGVSGSTRRNQRRRCAHQKTWSLSVYPSVSKSFQHISFFNSPTTHALFRHPNSRYFVYDHSSQFFAVAIPCDMIHRLDARYTIISRFEGRKSGRLQSEEPDNVVGPVNQVCRGFECGFNRTCMPLAAKVVCGGGEGGF